MINLFDIAVAKKLSGGGGGGDDSFGKLIDKSIVMANIPSGTTKIGDDTFRNCELLSSVTIPDTVTEIGGSAFNGCKSLETLTIPSSVTKIGSYVVSNSSKFQSMTLESTTPPTITSSTFSNIFPNFYVPAEAVDTYKTAQYWSSRAAYIYAIP